MVAAGDFNHWNLLAHKAKEDNLSVLFSMEKD